MKWFKHFSQANSDDKIVSIRAKFGMWGVGVYWTILEKVAEQMRYDTKLPTATIPIVELMGLCGCKRNKLDSFLEHSRNIRVFFSVVSGRICKIEIPKLLLIKDNYTKDLEETSQTLPSIEVDVEVDVDVDKSFYEKDKQKRKSVSSANYNLLMLDKELRR